MKTTQKPNLSSGILAERVAQLQNIIQAKPTGIPTGIMCEQIMEQLDSFVVYELNAYSNNAAQRPEQYAEFVNHLALCADCLAAYQRLQRVLVMEKENRLLPTRPPVAFDLSFLSSPFDKIRAAIERVGNKISLQFSADLRALLAPMPEFSIAGAVRGQVGVPLLSLDLAQIDSREELREAWPVTFNIYQDSKQPEHCILKAQVKPKGRAPFQRKGILLQLSGETDQWQTTTDAYGNAILSGIPITQLDSMKLEVVL